MPSLRRPVTFSAKKGPSHHPFDEHGPSLWSSHPAQNAASLTRREHGIGPASAWAAGEALRGEGILPSHAPQGAVLHMPVRRSARLSARGRAECPPPVGPDSEPNHRGINMLRNLFHGREGILSSLAACRTSDGLSRPNADRVRGRLGLGQEALPKAAVLVALAPIGAFWHILGERAPHCALVG